MSNGLIGCASAVGSVLVDSALLAGPPLVVVVPTDEPTIQDGIDAVAAGGVVIVTPGVYNETIDFGGKAMTLRSADPTDPDVVDATVVDGSGISGAVVSCVSGEGADTVLLGMTITGADTVDGTGILNVGSSPTVLRCVLRDNGSGGAGGGMSNSSSNPTVRDCTFQGNSALQGAGMYNDESDPHVVHCVFIENTANRIFDLSAAGGGMYNIDSDPVIDNCAFIGNTAEGSGFGGGGAMYNRDSSPVMAECTIVGNAGEPFGDTGGIYSRDASNPNLANCILWYNTPTTVTDAFGASTTITYSDVEDGWSGAGNIDLDPQFVDDDGADDDPDTFADNDYRLADGSPCIDAADNTAVPAMITTDLDGAPRFINDPDTADTGVGTPTVDMGAYEKQLGDACAADISGPAAGQPDGNVDAIDFLLLIGQWGTPCTGSCEADITGAAGVADGNVDALDFLLLLSQWGVPGHCP